MENSARKIVIPVDGSMNSFRSLDYLNLIYGPQQNLTVNLLYVLPTLPRILTEEEKEDKEIITQIKNVEKKNIIMAERILAEAKTSLIEEGFEEENVVAVYQKMEVTIPRDICHWARSMEADAILLGRRGRTDLTTFVIGEVCDKLVERCEGTPLWIVGGKVESKKVLLCIDASQNAVRAAEHAGSMLSGTDCPVTIFHTMRHLRRFVPVSLLEEAEELIHLWRTRSGQQLAMYINNAKDALLSAGIPEEQISIKVADGTRSEADDILGEALTNDYGTVIMGRRGASMVKEFILGSVSKKVLMHLSDLAICIVR